MRNIKLVIEYDGTDYHGWQKQINAVTVQETLENALEKLTGKEHNITGCSRTDVGVHAYGQVANFLSDASIPAERFSYALNSILPDDIVIRSSEEVSMDFHARYNARGKKYKYLILSSPYRSALYRHRAYHVSHSLDIEAMAAAAEGFLGRHDFSAFKAAGGSTKTSERTITGASVKRKEDIIEFEIAGDGFLYNMVRIMTGTLIEVGMGKIKPGDIPGIIESLNRKLAGRTAPAHGLYLIEIYY